MIEKVNVIISIKTERLTVGIKMPCMPDALLHSTSPPRNTQKIGIVIISVALWFMMGNSYAEFAFRRMVQYPYGRLNAIDENSSDVIDEENQEVHESSSSATEQMNNSGYARYRFQALIGVHLSYVALINSSVATKSMAIGIASATVLVIFRFVGTNHFSQLVRWRFLPALFLALMEAQCI